jgi:hypothetical protein
MFVIRLFRNALNMVLQATLLAVIALLHHQLHLNTQVITVWLQHAFKLHGVLQGITCSLHVCYVCITCVIMMYCYIAAYISLI